MAPPPTTDVSPVIIRHAGRIEGFAIVSEDGMLATADRVMPPSLIFDADKHFFERGLDGVDVVVHGRHSHEQQEHSPQRRRLILTRRVAGLEQHSSNRLALWWNPAGALLSKALAAIGVPDDASIGVIGGADVFALFLDSFDVSHLSRAPNVRLPGGRPVFPDVPERTPEQVLANHGLVPGQVEALDAAQCVTLVSWRRAQNFDRLRGA